MPDLKLKQLQYESESWKRELGFMTDENIHLKNRLSEMLRYQFDNKLLEEVETFHNHFLQEDERIGSLRNELQELDKLLVREIFEDGKLIRKVESKINKIRNTIRSEEEHFARIKENFNSYLSENLIDSL